MFRFLSFGSNVYGHLGVEIAPKWLRSSFLFQWVNTSNTSLKTRLFVLFISFFSLATLSAAEPPTNIEGKWRFEDSGATVLIYKENGLYVGRLLDAGNDEDNQRLEGKGEIFILRDFKKVSDVKYCCGTTYAPKKKRTLSSTLVVVEEDKLRIDLKIGFFSGTRTLIRL